MTTGSNDVVSLGDRRRPTPASVAVDPIPGMSLVGVRGHTDIEAARNVLTHIVDTYADGDESRVMLTAVTFGTEPGNEACQIAYATYAVDDPPPRAGHG